jgi:hypothetical protein
MHTTPPIMAVINKTLRIELDLVQLASSILTIRRIHPSGTSLARDGYECVDGLECLIDCVMNVTDLAVAGFLDFPLGFALMLKLLARRMVVRKFQLCGLRATAVLILGGT